MKQTARTVDAAIKKQSITGGGKLTNQEQRVIKSPGFLELAKKLGKSASGNVARDSDSAVIEVQPPTLRTARLFSDADILNISSGRNTFVYFYDNFECIDLVFF